MRLVAALCVLSAAVGAEYHVAPDGRDEGSGSVEQPFRTLTRAAAVVRAGDTCWVHAGVYRETVRPNASGEAGAPVRFVASPGERVVISGADVLTGQWTAYRDGIWQIPTDRTFVQLFVNGRPMIEARWPNAPLDDRIAMARATAGEGTDYDCLADPALPPGDYEGALVLIWPGARWYNATRRVVNYRPGVGFDFDRTFRSERQDPYHTFDPRRPRAGNPYLLYGCLAALDAPGEWHLDPAAQRLYLWPPDGRIPPDGSVEVKARELAFDLSGRSHIELRGFRILGAAIDLRDAEYCRVDDCHLRDLDWFREMPEDRVPTPRNIVTGRDNEWNHCSIVGAAGTALRIGGENNRLVNSIVHDVDTLGTYQGGVDLGQSVGAEVRGCTIYRAGRDLIQHHGSKRPRIEYNHLYMANLLNNDAGATYAWGTDGDGGVIAYNWIHDNLGDLTIGIYLDNFCKNFLVHHNVVWNNSGADICLNSDALGHLVANNTILTSSRPFSTFTYHGRVPTQAGTRIVNNLVSYGLRRRDPSQFVQGELGPEIQRNGAGAIDADGVPTADSAALDAGIEIPGVTDGYVGAAPDLGAYERGAERWVAGADWVEEDAPPAPVIDLTFTPPAPVTEQTMLTAGLVLWLDAADSASVERDATGLVRAWRDRSGARHDALPGDPAKPLRWIETGLNGRPVVRGTGAGHLRVGTIRAEPGPLTLYVVSQATSAEGPAWQRILGAWSGAGDDWVAPNWIVLRPGGEHPEAYEARIYTIRRAGDLALAGITLFGSPLGAHQFLAGDIAEVLLYDRLLTPAEATSIEDYLTRKWGLAEP